MNVALNQIRKVEAPAFATIGVDGEGNDLIDGRAKPLITTLPGDYLVTTRPLLDKSNGLFELLKVFPYKTVLGQLVVAKTLRGGTIELVGPENNAQLSDIIDFLKNEIKCQTIVIDGAANRLTPVSAISEAGFFYVQYVDKRNMNKALENLKLLCLSASFPIYDKSQKETPYKIDGALTANKISTIPDKTKTISINNLTSVFLPFKQLKALSQKHNILAENNCKLNAFVLVTKDVEKLTFRKLYEQCNLNIELIDNPYGH
ncbi:hypothetical protein [Carboxylicivirga sp. N1Y90]|uniref:hypothetical protein n=1 Tax=Carboxylicivirga fragile TaxID=3417571 RepID=UPI003D336A26|nr:hypothetical protein [Marinilabiliaceae bacterium N1Y90]